MACLAGDKTYKLQPQPPKLTEQQQQGLDLAKECNQIYAKISSTKPGVQIPKPERDKFFELNMKLWEKLSDKTNGFAIAKLLHDRLLMSALKFDEIGKIIGVSFARLEADSTKVQMKINDLELAEAQKRPETTEEERRVKAQIIVGLLSISITLYGRYINAESERASNLSRDPKLRKYANGAGQHVAKARRDLVSATANYVARSRLARENGRLSRNAMRFSERWQRARQEAIKEQLQNEFRRILSNYYQDLEYRSHIAQKAQEEIPQALKKEKELVKGTYLALYDANVESEAFA